MGNPLVKRLPTLEAIWGGVNVLSLPLCAGYTDVFSFSKNALSCAFMMCAFSIYTVYSIKIQNKARVYVMCNLMETG